MRLLVLAALAATCNGPAPSPKPTPEPVPYPIPEDAGSPAPETDCDLAFDTMADAECPPVEGHAAWLKRCASVSERAVLCVISAKSCAATRACLETP